jgi:hypothetical protein
MDPLNLPDGCIRATPSGKLARLVLRKAGKCALRRTDSTHYSTDANGTLVAEEGVNAGAIRENNYKQFVNTKRKLDQVTSDDSIVVVLLPPPAVY